MSMIARMSRWGRKALVLVAVVTASAEFGKAARGQQDLGVDESLQSPTALLTVGRDQKQALQVNDFIYLAIGFGNTAMIVTDDGNVVVDTSLALHAPRHKRLLSAVSDAPVRYIVLTHGHADHRGGVRFWKQPETEVVAHRNYEEFIAYQSRLQKFFQDRNAAQFKPLAMLLGRRTMGGEPIPMQATMLVDDHQEFTLGGVKFELHHTPGETYDHLSLWLPDSKVAFIGDNYYASFPNIYTLRGTKPRWALDYIHSLDKIMSWRPEILMLGHGLPIHGADKIQASLKRYRDAIQYVHDSVVQGMNDGKDLYTLMREIRLPEELDVGERYGRLSWSIRGIYEGYVGWFDGDVVNIYTVPKSAVSADIVQLAGGPTPLLERAAERVERGELVEALHLTDLVLNVEPQHRGALDVRLAALEALREQANNVLEISWLSDAIDQARSAATSRSSR